MRGMIVSADVAFGHGLNTDLSKDDVGDLTSGAITVSRSDTNEIVKIDADEEIFDPVFPRGTKIQFIRATADGPILSSEINVDTLRWVRQAYVAPVAKVVHVGRNATAGTWTLPDPANHVGEYAAIRIYDLSAPEGVTNNVKSVEYLIKQGDDAAAVHDGLFAKLEKYKGVFYANVEKNVSTTNLGYKFTGIVGKDFRVIPELLLAGSVITVATNFAGGSGVGTVLAEWEKDYATHKGYNPTYHMRQELYSGEFFIDPSVKYDVFTLEWTNPNRHILAAGDDPMINKLLICAERDADATNNPSAAILRVLQAVDNQTVKWPA